LDVHKDTISVAILALDRDGLDGVATAILPVQRAFLIIRLAPQEQPPRWIEA
jgi:hypothetical protein